VRNRGTDRNPRWEAFYYLRHDGQRRQRSKSGFARKKDAEAWLRDELRRSEDGRASVPHRLTVGEVLDRWLESVGARVERSTLSGYERDIRFRLKPHLADVRLDELQPSHIVTMLAHLRRPGADRRQKRSAKALTETTLQHTFDTLRAALNWAVKSRLLGYNPALDVDRPQRTAVELQVWTFDELGQFMVFVSSKRFYPLLRLAAFTGMRRSELLGLMWRDLDLESAVLRVRRARIKDGYEMVDKERPKSSRGRRVVDLDLTTVNILRRWRRDQHGEHDAWADAYEESGAVFTNEDGTKLHADRVAQAFDRWSEAAPVPTIRFHDMRHTHASLLLAQGVPVVDVAYRLGDTPETILSTYAHFIPGQGQAAAALFAQMADGQAKVRRGVDGR
jgi:integrase